MSSIVTKQVSPDKFFYSPFLDKCNAIKKGQKMSLSITPSINVNQSQPKSQNKPSFGIRIIQPKSSEEFEATKAFLKEVRKNGNPFDFCTISDLFKGIDGMYKFVTGKECTLTPEIQDPVRQAAKNLIFTQNELHELDDVFYVPGTDKETAVNMVSAINKMRKGAKPFELMPVKTIVTEIKAKNDFMKRAGLEAEAIKQAADKEIDAIEKLSLEAHSRQVDLYSVLNSFR